MRRWAKRIVVTGAVVMALEMIVTHPTAWALVRYAAAPNELTVPVQGVKRAALHSSWGEPRSGHRSHQGIDIFARRGTPVVAATAGQVIRIGHDCLGGNVVWVAGRPSTLYYYAHLDAFEPGLQVGERVDAGTPLGRVGTTGNAKGTPPHLHFGMYPAVRAFWPMDPTPALKK